LQYAGYVSRAAATLLAGYRSAIAESARLAREADARRERLRAVGEANRGERDKVLKERREKRRVFEHVAAEVRAGRREIKVLRADEARLSRLIEGLGRIVYGRVEKTPELETAKKSFSSRRGQLRLPVAGELTGRFGAPRGATGIEAKGVFIRAPEGQPVRAIAGGQVVYADWMRGFGNLLIVDHGEAYLSIYANNESVLKQVGEAVSTGETIATTGASGGNEESGLYFELRHLGRAFDPLRWVKLK
jgi:septal ring factor EnvC (AmiA/AmiB activator)